MIKLIRNGIVYSPSYLGKKDILIADDKIVDIRDNISLEGLEYELIDAKGNFVVPGLIDSHVHVCGGGGEGGYKTRTPEIMLTDITTAGVTTVVGVLGTDGTSRTMSNLLAKVYALNEEGITAYAYTGSYQVPVRTVTGSITDDLILIERIVGTGEIAISDHRSSCPSVEELIRLASDTRIGGMLSGKAGVINLHLGDSKNPLKIIYDLLERSDIPITQFLPTHMSRNEWIMEDAVEYARHGGYVDFTTSTTKKFIEDGELSASKAVRKMIDQGIDISQITISSDGQGSLPSFDKEGNLVGLKIGKTSSVLECIKNMYFDEQIDLENCLKVATENPAKILKLKNKGQIKKGFDADVLILNNESLSIDTVIANGNVMIKQKEIKIKGTFE
ncbi:beta-aspartyl-peptidase [Soehngenia longivitae]|uniref:Isoaspartyl dipeptidase n=1 Tax=Soehngenia longivitae TaxID=2562294 RepID=A0A4Z0DA40_9FIRM|nr:beta-aspartyl-peptidase [Soehngenia longivitae]TFZ41725.1 beta-aspartyl-peptidase [Soehngenia longivitae]